MPSNSSPFSYVRYESSGSAGPYSINFDYLSSSHLSVSLNGVTQATSAYTIDTNANTVTFNSAPAAGVVIVIERSTPKGKSAFQTDVADFSDGSVLTAEDLDQAALGLLYVAQEADDSGNANSLNKDLQDEKWDASNTTIKNVPLPASSLDAVNKDYVDGLSLYNSPTPLQVYTFTGNTTDTAFVMSPAPQSADPKAFIVDVGGVAQRPTTDYTISGSTITFGTAPPATTITVRNIGVARDTLAQPILAENVSSNSLTVKAIDSQTSKLQEWQNTSGAAQASVDKDGNAAFKDVTATGDVTAAGDVTATGSVSADGVSSSGVIQATSSNINGKNLYALGTGYPGGGGYIGADIDITAGGDIKADKDIIADENIQGKNVTATGTGGGFITASADITASGNITATGTISAGTAFNVLGNLQFSGENAVKILKIHQFALINGDSAMEENSNSGQYMLSGLRLTATPMLTGSKFLVLTPGLMLLAYPGSGNTKAGAQVAIILNDSGSKGDLVTLGGSNPTGTRIGMQAFFVHSTQGLTAITSDVNVGGIYHATGTTPFHLDIAHLPHANSGTDRAGLYLSNRFCVAIEYKD